MWTRVTEIDLSAFPRYGINDIRTLVGHKVDVAQVRTAAAIRFDKGDA